MILSDLDEIQLSPYPSSDKDQDSHGSDYSNRLDESPIDPISAKPYPAIKQYDESNPLWAEYLKIRQIISSSPLDSADRSHLLRLQVRFTQKFPFICEVCNFYAPSMSCFTWHLNSVDHLTVVNRHKYHMIKFKCKICNSVLTSIETLIKHFNFERKRSNTKITFSSHLLRGPTFICSRILTQFRCTKCKLSFTSRMSRSQHMIQSHPSKAKCTRKKETKVTPIVKSTKTVEKINSSSSERCDTSLTCKICGSIQTRRANFNQHMARHVPYLDRKFSCPECSLKFAIKADLNKHLKTHSVTKEYSCHQCDYKGKSSLSLRKHLQVHLPSDTHKCSKCSFSCKTLYNLTLHEKTHSLSGASFKCPHCSYKAMNIENLRKHVLKTEQHKGLSIYLCDLCEFTTNFHKQYRLHQATVHGHEHL